MDDSEKRLREEILERVTEIYKIRKAKQKFIPGETKVNYAGRVFDENEMRALVDSSVDFWLTLGIKGEEFERNFSDYLGVKKTITCNSGSSANLLAVSSLCSPQLERRINEGDEIITTASNFPTTVAPIIQNKLVPVFLDVELGNYNMKTEKLEEALSSRTRAIVFAHTLGNPANMDRIMSFAKKNNLYVIEDSCDALDSKFNNQFLGSFGDISTFSFYAAHHITMGEGGAVCTNNLKLAKIIQSLRDWGRDCYCRTGEKEANGLCKSRFNHKFPLLPEGYDHKYVYSNIGYNLKPLDLQCAIGIEQIKKLPEFTKIRKENFNRLYETAKKYEDRIILPNWLPQADVSWFAFPITLRENVGFKRGEIVEYLESKKIETRMLFGGNILRQPGFSEIKRRIVGDLKNTDKIVEDTFFLGVYPGLDKEKMDYVCENLDGFFKKY